MYKYTYYNLPTAFCLHSEICTFIKLFCMCISLNVVYLLPIALLLLLTVKYIVKKNSHNSANSK